MKFDRTTKILLGIIAIGLWAVIIILIWPQTRFNGITEAKQAAPKKETADFDVITVHRINVVGPGGNLRMVISNSKDQSPGRLNRKKIKPRKRHAGMIFFNQEGDEVGGLIYGVRGLVFSVDQYNRDQIMQLQYMESKSGKRKYGLQLWDRNGDLTLSRMMAVKDSLRKLQYSRKKIAETLTKMNDGEALSAPRLFVGKKSNRHVGLFVRDKNGNVRIKIYVDRQNKTHLEFYDENGRVIPITQIK